MLHPMGTWRRLLKMNRKRFYAGLYWSVLEGARQATGRDDVCLGEGRREWNGWLCLSVLFILPAGEGGFTWRQATAYARPEEAALTPHTWIGRLVDDVRFWEKRLEARATALAE